MFGGGLESEGRISLIDSERQSPTRAPQPAGEEHRVFELLSRGCRSVYVKFSGESELVLFKKVICSSIRSYFLDKSFLS